MAARRYLEPIKTGVPLCKPLSCDGCYCHCTPGEVRRSRHPPARAVLHAIGRRYSHPDRLIEIHVGVPLVENRDAFQCRDPHEPLVVASRRAVTNDGISAHGDE